MYLYVNLFIDSIIYTLIIKYHTEQEHKLFKILVVMRTKLKISIGKQILGFCGKRNTQIKITGKNDKFMFN